MSGIQLDRPGRWQQRSACRGLDHALFFPARGESTAEAEAVCAQCAVRAECLDFALLTGQRFGIWGGTSERQRRRLRLQGRTSWEAEAS